jgi:Uma2 family endonuclease
MSTLRQDFGLSAVPEPPQERLLTAADLAALPQDLPSGTVCYELHHGRLIIMAPPGDLHGATDVRLTAHLYVQGECRGLGKARSQVGIILARNPDHVLGPDGCFVANTSLPIRVSSEGYLETIPDLVSEVRSKNDTNPELLQKVEDYLAAGVRVVWVTDPRSRTVTAYRRGQEPQVFQESDTLVVEDIIPGFKLSVEEIFRE